MAELREQIRAIGESALNSAITETWEVASHTTDDILRLLPPLPPGWVEKEWQDLLEKDDRTSPEEYPDMALITFEEFRDAMLAARPALSTETER